MAPPDDSRHALASDLVIRRLLNGMWQVSGAHGRIDRAAALEAMLRLHDAGFTTWDLADHYGPAEEFIGEFRKRLAQTRGREVLAEVLAFTKWVPQPGPMSRSTVRQAVLRSLQRMDVPALDLLQFHWWEYRNEAYLDALGHLNDLRTEGLIRHLALTNFDTPHLARIVEEGIPIASNQIQYSLIDRRPEVAMVAFCRQHGIGLLAYGTFCGGMMSSTYLDRAAPTLRDLPTASLRKYKQMIDAWGGWALFQDLLRTLRTVAERHGVSLANVAARYILDRPAVAGVIVGVRLGLAEHHDDNRRAFELRLDASDRAKIDAVLEGGHDLFRLIGDCGDEYR